MTAGPAIIGFRRDRIGARLIGLLNVLRLGQKFDVPARFLWLSEPSGPYPELTDPREFLAADFVDRHIEVVAVPPDLARRTDLSALAPRINETHLADRLAKGELFQSDAAFDITTFMGESGDEARASVARIAADLPLTRRLQRFLERAENRLARWSEGGIAAASAIHMRRGDLLDGLPWSLGAWPAKYVPDEFFRAWAAEQPGAVIVFTDTPDAARHMAAGDQRIVQIDRLLDMDRLRPSERDMLELLLMSRCARIGAPGGSAFSRAAAACGAARLVKLPNELAEAARSQAHDALLERVIARPDSFFAAGDLAQSAQYAARHAMGTGRAGALGRALAAMPDAAAAHPFLHRIVVQCALASGEDALALQAATQGLQDLRMVGRDRRICRSVDAFLTMRDRPGEDASADMFLSQLLSEKVGDNPLTDQMAGFALSGDTPAARALMFAPLAFAHLIAAPVGQVEAALPAWAFLADWEELLESDPARRGLGGWTDVHRKMIMIGPEGIAADAALQGGTVPATPEDDQAFARIGLTASVLSLHGRYARALNLLHWLDSLRPGMALTLKRMADTGFRSGNADRGFELLEQAFKCAPESPLLHLSMARRAAERAEAARALDHLDAARKRWKMGARLLIRQQRRCVMRALAAD